MNHTLEKAEAVAESVWLRLAGRVAMTLLGALALPLTIAAIGFARDTDTAIGDLTTRVSVLETSTKRGREDREKFQDQTTHMLQELLRVTTATAVKVAALEAQNDALRRELDQQRR